jgi:uncharacterized membrane protein YfcA
VVFAVAAFAVVAVAAAVQTVVGFGFALLAVPVLTLLADARTAVVGLCFASMLPSIVIAIRDRGHLDRRTTGLFVAASLVGMPAGLLLLRALSPAALTMLIALVLLLSVVVVWRRLAPPAGASPTWAALGAGVVSGALGTATGASGPPVVASLQALALPPRAFRATIAGVFAVTNLVSVPMFLVAGEVTPLVGRLALVGAPASMLGWLVGDRIFGRLPADWFRRVVLLSLVVAALVIMARAVIG